MRTQNKETKTALCACCECINTKQILALGLEYCPLKVITTIDSNEGIRIANLDKDHVGGRVYESEGFGWTWGGQRGLKVTGCGVMSLAGKVFEWEIGIYYAAYYPGEKQHIKEKLSVAERTAKAKTKAQLKLAEYIADIMISEVTLQRNSVMQKRYENQLERILRESVPMRALFSYRGPNIQDCRLFLQRRVFSHGQLYVACFKSQDEKIKGLNVLCCDKDDDFTNFTSNVVYKEVYFMYE
ncbi:hypothetical protein Tco_0654971 [Tanacetum coccineum]|uniref:Uncharacterized protein n=1 Tax=Tanacetum coccineum TaxID=301880 RepID=A0ABQ4X517_9ASTR